MSERSRGALRVAPATAGDDRRAHELRLGANTSGAQEHVELESLQLDVSFDALYAGIQLDG